MKELTWDKTSYVMTCGADMKNGVRKPRVWRLGADERWARVQAEHIRFCWDGCVSAAKAAGKKKAEAVWTEDHLKLVAGYLATKRMLLEVASQQVADFQKLASDPREQQPVVVVANTPKTHAEEPEADEATYSLSQAIDHYEAKLDADVRSGERSRSDAARQMISMKQFKRFIADQPYDPDKDRKLPKDPEQQRSYFGAMFQKYSPVCDRDVNQIGYDQIAAFKSNIQNRRVSGYAPLTVKGACQHVGNFFGWLEDSRKWKASCNYDRLLKVKAARLYTPSEQKAKAKGQKTYTLDELAYLYAYANEQQRLYLMLGCNLVAAQQTLADLLLDDLHLDDDQPHVEFIRGKTRTSANGGSGIEVRYDLWPTTATLLKKRIASTPRNEAGLAMLTADGHPLVRHDSGPKSKSKTDSVGESFRKLLIACNAGEQRVRPLGFKYLRKTVSTWILNTTQNEYIQQQALAQSRKTVAGQHYTGAMEFQKMNDTLKAFWSELEPKCIAEAAKVEAVRLEQKQARRAAYIERQKVGKAARYAAQKAAAVATA